MSLSRRQRSVGNVVAGEQQQHQQQQQLAGDNLAPPTYDAIKLTSPPPTPPPPPLQRLRPSNDQAPPTAPNSLRQVWPCSSSLLLPPAGEAPGNSAAFFASSKHGRAPVSADSIISASDGRKQGYGRWLRLKGVGSRVSLVIVVGALLFDVYLLKVAFSGARGKQPSNGGGLSGEPLPSRWTQGAVSGDGKGDNRDSSAAKTWSPRPTEPSRVPPEREGSGTWTGQLRSIWARVTATNSDTPVGEGGTPKTGAERDLLSHRVKASEGSLGGLNRGSLGREPTTGGQQLLGADNNAALNTEDSIPGLELGTAHVPRPLPQPRPGQARPDPYDGQRVAVVVPYVGTELPVWWEAFAEQAKFNEGLVDWIIFCDKKLVRKGGPPNIKFFPMDTRRMAWLLAGVVEADVEGLRGGTVPFPARGGRADGGFEEQVATSEGGEELVLNPTRLTMRETLTKNLATRKRAASFLHQLLLMSPYYIVEFKPALGWLFREYLGEYTHWAYGDLDVLFGDMRNGWLEPEELNRFDIITFSFGDQYRAYLRGQLTIHKNEFRVNRVWRGCSHLINYSDRLEAFRANRSLPLESAEGCYSRAAALDTSLKIKFTVKALSDVDEEGESGPNSGREVIIDGHGLVTLCPDLGYYDGPAGARRNYGAAYAGLSDGPSPSMQDAVGPITAVKRSDASEGRCEHWIKPEHQTCVENVGGSHTLFLLGGEYYKQEFINTATATGGRDCRAGAFYHFQAHKLNFRVWNSLPPVPRAHFGVAAGPGGIVPLPAAGWRESVSGPGIQPPAEHTQKAKNYCLAWMERKRGRSADDSHPEQVCAVRVSGSEAVTIVDTRPAPPISGGTIAAKNAKTITLGSVGHPSHLPSFLSNAGEWEGPKIFAMALDSAELAATRQMAILNRVKYIRGGVLIVALVLPPPNIDMPKLSPVFPEKALMNLVSDLCESRYLLTLPGLSRLSPNAFKTVFTQLHHRSPGTAASKRTGGSRPNVPGPVTLVVPYDTPTPTRDQRDYGGNVGPPSSALSVSAAAAAATATAAASAHRAATLVLERAWANLAASKTAEAAAEGAMNAAAKTAAAVASAVRDGDGRLPVHPSDGDDSASTMSGGGSGIGGAGSGGNGGGGPERPPHPEKREAAAAAAAAAASAELVPLQITFGTAAAGRVDGGGVRSDARSEGPKVRKKFRKRGDTTQGHRRANTPPPQQGDFFLWHRGKPVASSLSGREEAGAGLSPSQIRAPRRLDALAASAGRDSSGEGAGKGAAWSSGSSEAIEWDVDGLEVTEWLRESLLSGPGMPGLVVDLWSPGALFLRRVEEFGGSGCMDAAYALGLWRAGSSFQVVQGATLTLTDPTVSSDAQSDSYSGAKADPDSGHVFHVPGGACLLREAVAKTASIYSTFLVQVANVYRHPRSEIAGQQPRRTYKDHWDYMPDDSETTSTKPWAGDDAKPSPFSHVRPPAAGVFEDDDIVGNGRDGGRNSGGGGGGGVRGRSTTDHP